MPVAKQGKLVKRVMAKLMTFLAVVVKQIMVVIKRIGQSLSDFSFPH